MFILFYVIFFPQYQYGEDLWDRPDSIRRGECSLDDYMEGKSEGIPNCHLLLAEMLQGKGIPSIEKTLRQPSLLIPGKNR